MRDQLTLGQTEASMASFCCYVSPSSPRSLFTWWFKWTFIFKVAVLVPRARASMTLPATKFIARPAARRGRRAGAKNYRWQQPVPQRCQPAVASTLLTRFLKSSGPNNMKLENGITSDGASEKDRSHVRQHPCSLHDTGGKATLSHTPSLNTHLTWHKVSTLEVKHPVCRPVLIC